MTETQTVVETTNGKLAGSEEEGIAVFRGVPYAAPPVGDLRWRPPEPVTPWDGTRDATVFSPVAWQKGTDINDFMNALISGVGHGFLKRQFLKVAMKFAPKPEESEDCLYLNIRTPDLEGSLPVMVWIHGGDHQDGAGSEPFYDSNVLPNLGVVLVTINYRLGLLGNFCHPELSAESDKAVCGNYGTLDQVAALAWVRDNISCFGGDPDNVTVFGESAGGESVAHMLTSPLARGLFHRAILQSAANSGQMGLMNRDTARHQGGEAKGHTFATGLVGSEPGQVERLRAMPADQLMTAVREANDIMGGWFPVIDGYVLPYSPFECFQRGQQAKVPIMVGSNSDEGSVIFPMMQTPLITHRWEAHAPDALAAVIREEFGEDAERLFALYPGLEQGDAKAQELLLGDSMFGAKAQWYATQSKQSGQDAFLYYFEQASPLKGQTAGAFHAAEIAFVFGSEIPICPIDDDGRALSAKLARFWSNFARSGDPSDNELPPWQPVTDEGDMWMRLGPDTGMSSNEKREKYEILNRWLKRELASLASS